MKDAHRLAVVGGVFLFSLLGWSIAGYPGSAVGLALGVMLLVAPWRGQPVWSWVFLYVSRNRPIGLTEPVKVVNDRFGGGVRYEAGVAIAAVQLLGKLHQPTLLAGSTTAHTANTIDIGQLPRMMRHSLGLTVDSISVISSGSRRRNTGDYPRVYDTLIGGSPYAGHRETWLLLRIRSIDNADALRWRTSAGTTALATAQRIAAALRCDGIRARAATASDLTELDRRLGRSALEPHNRRWHTLRRESSAMTTYAYRPSDLNAEVLSQAWTLQADGIIQNITVFPDGTACASVTVRSPQPPTRSPSAMLQTLPGEQAAALANNLCGPRSDLRGQQRGSLPGSLTIAIGPSGVLIGKTPTGDRLLLPFDDPGEFSRVRIAADDSIAKRLVIRTAAGGERITVHTTDPMRWESVRMADVVVTDQPRPTSGTALSVVDGSMSPAPRPNTVIEVVAPGTAQGRSADVEITQTGPATVEVRAAGEVHTVEVEFFRAEKRFVSPQPIEGVGMELETVD